MSTKISFFSIGAMSAGRMNELIAGMAKERYSDKTARGFIISEQSQVVIAGRYIEKVSGTEKVTDPLGNVLEFPVVHFFQQEFELSAKHPYLLLFRPGSLAKHLVGRLAEFSDFTFSVAPVEFETEKVLKSFSNAFEGVRVYSATIESLTLSAETNVKLSFESSGKLEEEARQFLRPKRYKFSTVKFSFEFSNQTQRCEIKSSGSINVYGDEDPDLKRRIIDVVRPYIAAQT